MYQRWKKCHMLLHNTTLKFNSETNHFSLSFPVFSFPNKLKNKKNAELMFRNKKPINYNSPLEFIPIT